MYLKLKGCSEVTRVALGDDGEDFTIFDDPLYKSSLKKMVETLSTDNSASFLQDSSGDITVSRTHIKVVKYTWCPISKRFKKVKSHASRRL